MIENLNVDTDIRTLHIMDVSPLFYWNMSRMVDRFSIAALKSVVYKINKYTSHLDDIVICSDARPTVKYANVENSKNYYKANRAPLSDEQRQYRACFERGVELICEDLDIVRQHIEGYESDDLIYATVQNYRHMYDKIIIHSADSDMLFMIDEKVSVDRDSYGFVTIDNYTKLCNRQYDIPYNMITIYNICTKNKDNRGTVGRRALGPILEKVKDIDPKHFCKVEDTWTILSKILSGPDFDKLILALPFPLQDRAIEQLREPERSNVGKIETMYNEVRANEFSKSFARIYDEVENFMGGAVSV